MSNELITKQQQNAVSVFDDFEQFKNSLEMAVALSKTKLIPKNFQNCPEDCLIALDYSKRLGLPPTAVLPHLYVIQGCPATSAQFMISLVNRSGKFSRIQWRETQDGKVEYAANGIKRVVINYGAVAWFDEVATGAHFESPKIDVRYALDNGWLTKNDSKWQKMPQVMCRYRSASVLIKTVCPELALGMEFVDDLQDFGNDERAVVDDRAAEVEQAIDAEIVEPNPETQEAEFYELKDAIETADAETLRAIGRKIADSNLGEQYKDELREAFKARRAAIAAENRAPAQEPVEKKARAPRKKAAAQNDDGEMPLEARGLMQRIGAAQNFGELSAAWFDAEQAIIKKSIPSGLYDELHAAFKARVNAIKSDVKEQEDALYNACVEDIQRADGTDEQRGWAEQLASNVAAQTDAAFIRANSLSTADEWRDNGALTGELHNAIVRYARARIAAFFEG